MSLLSGMSQLIESFPRVALAEIRSRNQLLSIITSAEGDTAFAAGADTINENKVVYDSVSVAAADDRSGQHADWAESKEYSGRTVSWRLDRHKRCQVKLRRLDVMQSPVLSVETGREDCSNKIATAISGDVLAYAGALTTHAQGAAANPAANNNAGSIMALPEWGTYTADDNGAYIDHSTGEPVSAGTTGSGDNMSIGRRITVGIRSAAVVLERAYILGSVGQDIAAGGIGNIWVAMAPEVKRTFVDYIEDELGLHLESVSLPAVRDGEVGGEDLPMAGELAVGKYRGLYIISSPDLAKPANAEDGWPVLIGSSRAIYTGMVEPIVQVLTPETNQTSPNYEVREAVDHGRQLVNSSLIVRATVNSGG